MTATTPSDAATVAAAQPTFAGTAGTRAADGTTITVKIWAGSDVSAPPVQTLTTERTGSTWQTQATAPLGNGEYVWRAEQSAPGGIGVSQWRYLYVLVPTSTGGTPSTPTNALTPGGDVIEGPLGGPPVGGPGPGATVSPQCAQARTALAAAQRRLTAAKRALKRARRARKKAARRRVASANTAVRRARARRVRSCGS